jgi:hypothetical protein
VSSVGPLSGILLWRSEAGNLVCGEKNTRREPGVFLVGSCLKLVVGQYPVEVE